MTLQELAVRVRECRRCGLCVERTQAVPGDGCDTAKVMLLGEAPGRSEDLGGRPFVGAAGRVLTAALAEVGWRREDVYITNLVKCRPPQNRDPLPAEMLACRPYFIEELKLLKPGVVILLGRHALVAVAPELKISVAHGKPFRKTPGGRWYCPAYHPAATLYSPTLKAAFQQDIQAARDCFDRVGVS